MLSERTKEMAARRSVGLLDGDEFRIVPLEPIEAEIAIRGSDNKGYEAAIRFARFGPPQLRDAGGA